MKKILIIMDSLEGGGAEKVLTKILENLNYNKFDVTLFLLKKEGIYLNEINKNVKLKYLIDEKPKNWVKRKSIYSLKKKYHRFILKHPSLINYIIKGEYELGIGFLEGTSTELLAFFNRVNKKIAWIHTDIEKIGKLYDKINKIVLVSEEVKKNFLKIYPEYVKKVMVIGNPIDKKEITYNALEKVIEIDRNEKINVVAVGRLKIEKGMDILLEAHNRLIKNNICHNLFILGEGSEREKLENFILKNKLIETAFLLGFKKNPYPYLMKADIVVIPSRVEGYSLVLAEALILGKAIISTDCSGPKELLENGKYGKIIKKGSIVELENSLKKFILSKEIRKKYSILSLEKSKIFDINQVILKIEKLFEELSN